MTRKYKTIATIILVALLLAPLSAYGTLIVRADDGQGARFTNITTTLVETLPGGPIYYDLCFNAPSPPTANGVLQIQRPDGSAISSPIVYTGRTCNFGAGYYFLQARFAGAQLSQTGGYQFLLACAAPGAGYTAPCLDPNTGLVTNFGGRTVGNSCQVNFTVGGAAMGGPVNCYDGQGQPPTGPTNTPVPVATNTPVPAATNTPVPIAATNTPVPVAATNTPVPVAATNTPVPVATNTSVPVATACPTNTPVPGTPGLATNTPVPAAMGCPTNTPVPVATNTSVPVATNTPVPVPTNTPVPVPTNTSVPLPSGTDLPVLVPTITPLPFVPGAPTATATPVSIPIAPGVPTNTPTPLGPTSTPGATSSHATATPTTIVRSIVKKTPVGKAGKAKAQLRVTLVPARLRPGGVAHVSISYAPRTRLRVAATFLMPRPAVTPRAAATASHHGKPSRRVVATPTATVAHGRRVKPARRVAATATKVVTRTVMTDVHGHATVAITVPPRVHLSKGHATASIVVQSLNARLPARATRKLAISDMLLSASAGPVALAGCVQTQLVKVRYYSNHTLRLVVLLAHGRRVTVPLRTDKSGTAATRLRLHFVDAVSPARVTLQAFNVRPGAYRMEQLTLRVKVPVSCRKETSTDITVTG